MTIIDSSHDVELADGFVYDPDFDSSTLAFLEGEVGEAEYMATADEDEDGLSGSLRGWSGFLADGFHETSQSDFRLYDENDKADTNGQASSRIADRKVQSESLLRKVMEQGRYGVTTQPRNGNRMAEAYGREIQDELCAKVARTIHSVLSTLEGQDLYREIRRLKRRIARAAEHFGTSVGYDARKGEVVERVSALRLSKEIWGAIAFHEARLPKRQEPKPAAKPAKAKANEHGGRKPRTRRPRRGAKVVKTEAVVTEATSNASKPASKDADQKPARRRNRRRAAALAKGAAQSRANHPSAQSRSSRGQSPANSDATSAPKSARRGRPRRRNRNRAQASTQQTAGN